MPSQKPTQGTTTPFERAKRMYGKQLRKGVVDEQIAELQQDAPELALGLMQAHLLFLLLEQLDENAELLQQTLDARIDNAPSDDAQEAPANDREG